MSALFITVDVRTVYGKEAIYPADTTAVLFADIAGTATLTRPALEKIQRLGYEIRRCPFPPVLAVNGKVVSSVPLP